MNFELIEEQGFTLVEQIEETSQTISWRAVQRTLDRTVILRILKPEAAVIPEVLEHFLSIARIVARVKSESIAAIFDIVSSGNLHYLITEHVDGPNLEELVTKSGPIAAEHALRIASALIDGLEQLWESSRVVHRNLKSTTVRLNAQGTPKIMDFSLAIPAGPGVNATAMDDGHIVGTPCFLSPEQAQGSHLLTCQSDMYALGITLYHLVTGVVPFEEMEVVDILAAHVRGEIAPPHQINSSVPPSFSRFLQHLMMKAPEKRPASWQAVLEEIRLLLAGKAITPGGDAENEKSTIAAFDGSTVAAEDVPQIRFKKQPKKSRFGKTTSQSILDEHARELRQERLLKQMIGWMVLLLWLGALFWYRAVYQADNESGNASQSESSAFDNTDAEDEVVPLDAQAANSDAAPPAESEKTAPDTNSQVVTPEALPVKPVVPPTNVPPERTADSAAPERTADSAAPEREAAKEVLPAGIPPELQERLAQALVDGSPYNAAQIVQHDPSRFQERDKLLELLQSVPTPEALVTEYLASRVGKPIIFEHNGRQRTVIPRGVKDGIIHLEANGRAVDIPVNSLSADEKLRWMERPQSLPQRIAYALVLMHSERKSEVPAYMLNAPLLAPVVSKAARIAATAAPTQ